MSRFAFRVDEDNCGLRIDQFISKKMHLTREQVKNTVDTNDIFYAKASDVNFDYDADNPNIDDFDLSNFKRGVKFSNKLFKDDLIFVKTSHDIISNIAESKSSINSINAFCKDKKNNSSFNIGVKDANLAKKFHDMIIFEDSDIIILNKSADLLTHSKPGASSEITIVDLMKNYLLNSTVVDGISGDNFAIGQEEREFIVHRLDRETSGLMILAKTQIAYEKLSDSFRNREIEKRYVGLVCGKLNPVCGKIDEYIGRDKNNRMKRFVCIRKNLSIYPDAKEAVTHFFSKENFCDGKVSLVEFVLETGRTHQIRVHANFIGCPILGDKLYGVDKNTNLIRNYFGSYCGGVGISKINRHMLHSYYLNFEHPITGEKMEFELEMPEDMKNVINFLKLKK